MINIILFSISLLVVTHQTIYTQQLKVGDIAPDFKLPYATSDTIDHEGLQLSDLVGKKVILIAFYPADWSTGCTKQMCSYRDNFDLFDKLNVEILAISGDYVWSHHQWAKHQGYQFKLLSDHDHKVAKLYDSYNSQNGYNKRTVFLIDKNGKIAYIDWKYSTFDDVSFNKLKLAIEKLTK